jgi:hypothetical protein
MASFYCGFCIAFQTHESYYNGLSLLLLTESGVHIAIWRPMYQCLVKVVAKTPESALHAKILVENAVDNIDVDDIVARRVNLSFTISPSVVNDLIGKGGTVLSSVENGK